MSNGNGISEADELAALLSEGLDLCIRARKLDDVMAQHLDRETGLYSLTRCYTPAVWVQQQYDDDLADWERRAKATMIRHGRVDSRKALQSALSNSTTGG